MIVGKFYHTKFFYVMQKLFMSCHVQLCTATGVCVGAIKLLRFFLLTGLPSHTATFTGPETKTAQPLKYH